jgi:hypothetical protein
MVSSSSFCLTDVPPVSAGVAEWLAICQAHEIAMLACMRAPSFDAVKRALDVDPLVMDTQAGQIARILWDSYATVTQAHSN